MRRQQGFSLIELLIVVAIIAALVGVAVPFFQDNLSQAQQTKAKQDLDTIRNAITLHDAQNRPMTGISLKPLVGRYLQELNRDPWGNEYCLDASVGLLISFGADGQAGGSGGDTDHYTFYKPALKIQRCQYDGAWGKPKVGTRMIMTMTKPFNIVNYASVETYLCLLRNTRDYDNGLTMSFDVLQTTGATPHDWGQDNSVGGMMNTTDGLLVLRQAAPLCSQDSQSITPTMAINFHEGMTASTLTAAALQKFGLEEVWVPQGPLDTSSYGSGAISRQRCPQPIPSYEEMSGGLMKPRNRGVKIERF